MAVSFLRFLLVLTAYLLVVDFPDSTLSLFIHVHHQIVKQCLVLRTPVWPNTRPSCHKSGMVEKTNTSTAL